MVSSSAPRPVTAVPLERLLSVAALTPGQACLVAVQLLEAAHRPSESEARPTAGSGRDPVTLDVDGTLRPGRPDGNPGTTTEELLEQLVRNARRLPTHPRPEQLALLHRLEEAAAASTLEADVRALMLRTAVADTLGAGAGERLTGQLGQLVEACAHLAGGARPAGTHAPLGAGPARAAGAVTGGRPAASGPPRPVARRETSAQPATSRPSRRGRTRVHRRAPRRRAALVALVVVAVLVATTGYAVLRGTGGDLMGALGLGGGTAGSAATHTGHPSKHSHAGGHGAVPTLAARHNGAVRGVVLRKTGACSPGAVCPVRITVHLRPSPTSRTVSWKVGAARLCRRGLSWSPPTAVTVRPGRTTVHASWAARVPKGRSLALVALTTAPARAQSRPVPVTGAGLRC